MARLEVPPGEYKPDIQGVCQWACENSGLSFSKLTPEMVTITLADGRQFKASEKPPEDTVEPEGDHWTMKAQITTLLIEHPDSDEAIVVEVGSRQ